MTRASLINNKGQSLVGALVGIAIAGISMLAIMTGLQFGQQGQNQVKYIMDLDNFNEEIRALLSDPAACTNSFGGKVAAAGQSYTISGLYDGTTAPGVVRYTAGSVYGDNSLKLNSMTLKDFMAGAVSTKAQMTLVNDVSSQKVSIGGQAKPRTVNLSLDLDAAGKIVNCIALAKMSDGIWQRTSTNVNNIFFMPPPASPAGGNVGIGTAMPMALLDVSGPIRVGYDTNTCDSANEGRLRYNSTGHMMEFCNGTTWYPMGAKIYQVSNPPGGVADLYSLDQAHQTAFCDAGDKVLGGGGTCPLCDAVGNPACAYGSFYIDHNSQAITQSGQEGWAYDCDLQGNNIDDATSTFVICLDLPPYR